MAYTEDKEPLELTSVTTLDDADLDIIGDASDSSEVVKGITWANRKTLIKTFVEGFTSYFNVTSDTSDAITEGSTKLFLTTAERAAIIANTAKNTYPSADSTKLSAIEGGATADQTGAEIKVLYESESNTNAYTDAEKSKLAAIESGATADQTGSEIEALLDAELGSTDWKTGGGGSGGNDWADPVDQDIIPDVDSTRDLGSTDKRFAQIWGDDATFTNTLVMQDVSVTNEAQVGGLTALSGDLNIYTIGTGDINLNPQGTGNVLVGNFEFDADQSVGAGQDNYVLTYDNSTGLISLEASSGSGLTDGDKGDVTVSGSGSVFTADPTMIVGKTLTTPQPFDKLLFSDISDSDNLKQASISDVVANVSNGTIPLEKLSALSATSLLGNSSGSAAVAAEISLINEASGIASNDNDTSVPTSAAVKDFVDSTVDSNSLSAIGNLGATQTIDRATATHFTGTANADSTITFSNVGALEEVHLVIAYDGTSQRSITYVGIDEWANGNTPTSPSSTSRELHIRAINIGGTVYGFHSTGTVGSGSSSDVTTGAGAPTSAPTSLNSIYKDTTNKRVYYSFGTSAVSDWRFHETSAA